MREKLYILTQEELNFIIIESYQKGQKDGYGDSNFHVSDIKHPEPITVPDDFDMKNMAIQKSNEIHDKDDVYERILYESAFVDGMKAMRNELLKTKRK